MKLWDKFTNQYSLSKTLRFELKPEGKTKEMFENGKRLENKQNETTKKWGTLKIS